MKKSFGIFTFILFFVLGTLLFSVSASAYLDPSAVTFIVQAVAGIAIASVTAVGFYFKKLKRKFKKGDDNAPVDTISALELSKELEEFDDSEFDVMPKTDFFPVNPNYKKDVTVKDEKKKAESNVPETTGEGFKAKLKYFWSDTRSYAKRFVISVFPVFFLVMTFVFFGPFEMALTNSSSLVFKPLTVGLTMGLSALGISIAVALIMPLLRGRLFNYAVCATFATSIAGYLQGNFLNGELGSLTGDTIGWHLMLKEMTINLVIWAVIFIIPFILSYFSRKIWKNAVQFVSIIIIAAQIVGIVSLFITPKVFDDTYLSDDSDYYFSEDDLYKFSSDHNVVVFLLDRLDYDCITEVLKHDPNFFDKLDGFTSYTNAISEFARTLPGASHILTGFEENVYLENAEDYLDNSYSASGKNILEVIKNAGYDIDIYSTVNTMFGTPTKFTDYVSNMSTATSKTNYQRLVANMSLVSAYRYAPIALKPFFWCYSDDINAGIYIESTRYEIDEIRFDRDLEEMSLDTSSKHFKFYHFNGPHAPYILNEDGTKSEFVTSRREQTMGSFNILYRTFEKMKELGIYESSEIFIVADHGEAVSDKRPLQKATAIGLFHKPSGASGTELKYNDAPVSHKNIPSTILRSMGVENYLDFGTPLDAVKENDETVVRYFYKSVMEDGHEKKIYKYEIKGHASDFKNYKIVDEYLVVDYFY